MTKEIKYQEHLDSLLMDLYNNIQSTSATVHEHTKIIFNYSTHLDELRSSSSNETDSVEMSGRDAAIKKYMGYIEELGLKNEYEVNPAPEQAIKDIMEHIESLAKKIKELYPSLNYLKNIKIKIDGITAADLQQNRKSIESASKELEDLLKGIMERLNEYRKLVNQYAAHAPSPKESNNTIRSQFLAFAALFGSEKKETSDEQTSSNSSRNVNAEQSDNEASGETKTSSPEQSSSLVKQVLAALKDKTTPVTDDLHNNIFNSNIMELDQDESTNQDFKLN